MMANKCYKYMLYNFIYKLIFPSDKKVFFFFFFFFFFFSPTVKIYIYNGEVCIYVFNRDFIIMQEIMYQKNKKTIKRHTQCFTYLYLREI